MNEQIFWILIEQAKYVSKNETEQVKHLTGFLSEWSVEMIIKFQEIYLQMLHISQDSELWAAASVIHNGCSQEVFLYFQNWLLLQGQTVFKKTLQDPDFLADWLETSVQTPCQNIELQWAARNALSKQGKDLEPSLLQPCFFDVPKNDLLKSHQILDILPILCQRMGWGNELFEGDWQTDDQNAEPQSTS